MRELNEDAFFVSSSCAVVADGMGGHAGGEIAASIAVEECAAALGAGEFALTDVEPLLEGVNDRIRERGRETGAAGMGTTLVGAAVVGNGDTRSVIVFNIGDSRCYRVLDGDVSQLTVDHSHVQELIDRGELVAADAWGHPMRNVVTRALGADPVAMVDYVVLDDVSCRLLLCSDGVSGQLTSETLSDGLTGPGTPQEVADRLVEDVLAGTAPDNATAVVVDVDFQSSGAPGDDTMPNAVVKDRLAEITAPRQVASSEVATPQGEVATDDLENST